MRSYILHFKDHNQLISETEAIQNALDQEKEGIKPSFIWYDSRRKETVGRPGWLVWSTWADGCGVVYRRDDGKMILVTGWQGDFCQA